MADADAELNFGEPADIASVLAVAAGKRSPAQKAGLIEHLAAGDKDTATDRAALVEAEKPLPPGQGLAEWPKWCTEGPAGRGARRAWVGSSWLLKGVWD